MCLHQKNEYRMWYSYTHVILCISDMNGIETSNSTCLVFNGDFSLEVIYSNVKSVY